MVMLKFNWMRCSMSLFGVSDNVVAMLLERYALVSRRNSVDIAAMANPDRILPRRDDSVRSEGARRYIIIVNKVSVLQSSVQRVMRECVVFDDDK